MGFTKRTTIPDSRNKYYTKKENGGYNPCILGNTKLIGRPWNDSVLPNCVGYATGRFAEIIGAAACKYLGNTNAENFYALAKQQGLKVGQTPKVGACIVWQGGLTLNGNDGCGHVAIVEEVISDTEIIVSQSGWNSSRAVWTAKHKKGIDSNWIEGDDYNWQKSGNYKFLGFIYNPVVTESDTLVVKDLTVNLYGKLCNVKSIVYQNENYVRLRDFEEVLHLCGVNYLNNQILINGKVLDMNKISYINQSNTYFIRLKDFQDKLHLCIIGYNPSTKTPLISAR